MDFLKMIRAEDIRQLIANWTEQQPLKGTRKENDFAPVVKLFNPVGPGTWLITELEPDSSLAFGLCDLGQGTPELGYVCLDELATIRLRFGLSIEQDIHFRSEVPLSVFATESRELGYIRA